MKKIVFIFISLFILTGCTNLNNSSTEKIINDGLKSSNKIFNQYRSGYKYYLPRGLNIENQSDYNEILNNERYTYYLYVDIISYFNHSKIEVSKSSNSYYFKELKGKNKSGYINIREFDEKYLVEIMYNYAKIEVIVKEKDINTVIANALSILNSISYNDKIITNLIGDNKLQYKETELEIFDKKKTDSNYINYEEMYGQYEETEEDHDADLIE